MPCLSKTDIEKIAEGVISRYKAAKVPEKHLCYSVDPMELASMLGLIVDFQDLSVAEDLMGITSPNEIYVTVRDDASREKLYYLDGRTVLVDSRLRDDPKLKGRMNFTLVHEIAHQIIYRTFPEFYGPSCPTLCDYCRSSTPHDPIKDWQEWQVDTLAAELLLPLDAIQKAMFVFGLGEKMKLLSRKYSPNNYEQFCEMADFLRVSKTTLSYRMEQLGLLERNGLLQEAREGVC